MKLEEFIQKFAETHELQRIDELKGTIKSAITNDIYLVDISEVSEK